MKRQLGVMVGFCLCLTLLSISSVSSAASQIVGTKCVKAGSFRIAKNVKYQCKKSAQGLRWVTISANSRSTATTTTTIGAAKLPCAKGGECAVGDTGPGGGIVFYIDIEDKFPNWQYLEIAPTFAALKTSFESGGVTWSEAFSTAASYSTSTADDWFLPSYWQLATALLNLFHVPENPKVWAGCDTFSTTFRSECQWMWTSDLRATTDGYYSGKYAHHLQPFCPEVWQGGTPTGVCKKEFKGSPNAPFWFTDLTARWSVRAIRGFNSDVKLTTKPVTTFTTATTTTVVTTTTSTTFPLYSDPEITDVKYLLNLQECQIRDATPGSSVSSGFPRPDSLRSGFGQLEVLVIPVNFTDLTFGATDAKLMETAYAKVNSFYSAMSYGKAAVKMTLAPSSAWVDTGGTVEQNGIINTPPQWDGSNFYRKVIEIYLRNIVISGYDVVDVVTAYSNRWAGGQAMPSGSNSIYGTGKSFAGTQLFGLNTQRWDVIAHELGHAWLGFEDLYLFKGGAPLGQWDTMSSYPAELSGWSRFLAGWIEPNWVRCATPRTPTRHYLSALNADKSEDKPRMLVLPLNSQSAIIAELRTPTVWQPNIKSPTLVVYRVDTGIAHGNGPIVLIGTTDQIGGTVLTDGIKITVKGLNSSGVIVEVGN